jgi:hypothetical protein
LFLEIRKENWEKHKTRIFRYEIMWERLESLAHEIKEAWCTTPNREGLGGVTTTLRSVQTALRAWSKENFGRVTVELETMRGRLESLKADPQADPREIRSVMDRVDELLYREEMMWLQRSRIAWLREGDRNTSYFHRQAVWRARKNRIKKLRESNGDWHESRSELEQLAFNFFKSLYEAGPRVCSNELLELVGAKVTDEMNTQLCREVTEKENSDALFQMGPLKAPGPDGFPARFFQRHWEFLRMTLFGQCKIFL